MTQRDSRQLERIIGEMTEAEKQELVEKLRRLMKSDEGEIAIDRQAASFYDEPSLDELIAAQGVKSITNVDDLYGEPFEEEDDFAITLRRWRANEAGLD